MPGSLDGKIAIVTGGGRGIGKAIALELAKRGASVAITYVSNASAAEATVKSIKESGDGKIQAIAIKADVKDLTAGETILKETLEGFKTDGFDILVNNAGASTPSSFAEATVDQYAANFDTNLRGPIFITQALLPSIRRGGRVIFISSQTAKSSLPSPYIFYAASKAALQSIMRSLAVEYGVSKGITVNAVMPGGVDTDLMAGAPKEMVDMVANSATAEKRMGQPDDIAQCVAFLAEEGSRWVHGDTLNATGGAYIQP